MAGLADLALSILKNSRTIYKVTSPSFDEVPIMSEERELYWRKRLTKEQGNIMSECLKDMTSQEFRENFYEKDGNLSSRSTYETNKQPKVKKVSKIPRVPRKNKT